ncbi:MAG TPA: 23S rRNA (pseudouridine(1915)-N(3))-methyltransferase RlmH [Bacteroidales bacterium]|nr:23S rRNA (pseudouridine(1915)-N(3))-methyltransferase RlmH [Bacteroidales bacterium]HSA43498.1 23S rRNA (pseudouridine(1915)-N(3))-methyltransferase RlmH [Bacteroidales bacterium]
MKLHLIFTGKTEEAYLKEGLAMYLRRLQHYIPVEVRELTPPRQAAAGNAEQIKKAEGRFLLSQLEKSAYLVLLDETGRLMSSVAFAEFLQARMNQGIRDLGFLIGGAYGVTNEVRESCRDVLSLSPMTFTHQMSRLILMEQLYRAFTILKREPYHNI